MVDLPALPSVPDAAAWLGEVETMLAHALDWLELTALESGSSIGTLDLRWSILIALGELQALKPI